MFANLQDALLGERTLDTGTRLIIIVLTLVLTALFLRLAVMLVKRVIRLALITRARLTRGATSSSEEAVNAIAKPMLRPLRWVIITIGVRIAVGWLILGPAVLVLADQIASSVILGALFWFLYRVEEAVSQYYLTMPRPDGSRLDETIIRFLRQVAIVVILVAGIAIVLQRWGLDVGAIFAGLGIASLAVALAAQDALSNIIAYFAIVADTPFKVGDFIIIDGQNRGRVREITFRSTRIRTVDNSMLIIPNSKIANAQILNWERVSKRRLDFLLSLPKDTPQPLLEMFMAETRAMLAKNDQVSPERIVVEFVELTDSALKVRITFLAKANSWEDLEAVKTQVNLKLMKMTRTLALQVSSTVT